MYEDQYRDLETTQQNERLRSLLAQAESNLYYEKYQHAHEYNQVKVQLKEWQLANQPGGWIDFLRKENQRLRDLLTENGISF